MMKISPTENVSLYTGVMGWRNPVCEKPQNPAVAVLQRGIYERRELTRCPLALKLGDVDYLSIGSGWPFYIAHAAAVEAHRILTARTAEAAAPAVVVMGNTTMTVASEPVSVVTTKNGPVYEGWDKPVDTTLLTNGAELHTQMTPRFIPLTKGVVLHTQITPRQFGKMALQLGTLATAEVGLLTHEYRASGADMKKIDARNYRNLVDVMGSLRALMATNDERAALAR